MSRRRARAEAPGASRTGYGWARVAPYSPPWLTWGALPLLVVGARMLAARGLPAAMLVAVGLTVAAGGLTAFTWHVFKARGRSVQVHATAYVGVGALWVLWAAIAGLWSLAVWAVWAFAGVVGGLTWSIRRAARGSGDDTHQGDDGGLLEAIGIAGRPAGKARLEADGARVRLPVQMERGQASVEDLQGAKGRIASAAGVRKGAVRVEPEPDDHSRGDVVVVPRDLLRETIPYPGPSAPGASIVEELQVGRYEGGDTTRLWLPGDPKAKPAPRNATHIGVMGMTGSGKSESVLVALVEAMTRPDCSVVYSDPIKGIQTVAPIAAGVGLLLTEQKPAVAAFRRLPVAIRARTAAMGRHGFRQWTPDVYRKIGMKYLVCVWEEAADLLADSELFVKVTEQARSAGITLIPSQQRLSHDRMSTSARYNLGGGWCFGVGDDRSATFALSPQTLDAGAVPEEWKANKPGYAYLEAPGVPEVRWPEPMRAYLGDPDHLREVIAEHCRDAALDPVTANAFGKVYSDYRRQVLDGGADWQQPTRTAIAMPAGPTGRVKEDQADKDEDGADDGQEGGLEGYDPRQDPDMPAMRPQPEPGFMDDADPSQELPEDDPDPPIRWGRPAGEPRPTASAAKALLRAELARRAAEGAEEVTTGELAEYRAQVLRRSPAWLSGELRALVAEGVLDEHPDRGVYGLRTPVPV